MARARRTAGALALALLAAAGCAGAPPPQAPGGGEQEILRRQERVSGVGEHYPLLWDAEVLDAVRRTGDDVAAAVGAPADAFHYYVLDKPVLNAFTSPTGDIFFFTGQLAAMRTRSELAGVLAHEIAHVRAGHFERIQKRLALGTVPAMAAIILSGGNPAVVAGTIGLLQSYQLAFSREMEEEADRLSLLYLRRTGYDPRGLLGALRLIEIAERLVPSGAPEHLRTHPMTAARLAALEDGLGAPPGEQYRPGPDPAWERVRAVILAIDEPERALAEYGARAAAGGALELALLGVVHARRGDPAAAADALRRAAAADPGSAVVAADLGAALWSLGDAAGAREQLERSLGLPGGGGFSRTHYLLGEILRAAGRGAEALERYRRATELAPPLAEAHYQLALALGSTAGAGEADYHFGRAAALRGDYAGALRSFRQARARLGGDPAWSARIAAELRHME